MVFKIGVLSLTAVMALLSGCATLPLEERIVKEGVELRKRQEREQKNYERLKARVNFVCSPIVIPSYRNIYLNDASIKLAASCKRASVALFKYIAAREREDNIRNVLHKVFMNPDNYVDIRPGKVGHFPKADGTYQKMTPAEFSAHVVKIKKQLLSAASEVMIKEQNKGAGDALLLQYSVLQLWQMELAKTYVGYAKVMSLEERNLYRKELTDFLLWNDIVAGDQAVRHLTQKNRTRYFEVIIREVNTAASVARAVLVEIRRFQRICENRHYHKKGWEKGIAIAAEAARVAPYIAKAMEQSAYVGRILSYVTDEWALNWYDVEKDLLKD